MNDDERLLMLLQISRVNGNTWYLLQQGYSLTELTTQIENLKKQGLLVLVDNRLKLTEEGERLFQTLNKKLGRRGLYKYLSPDYTRKNEPVSIDQVYVPPYKRVKNK